MPGTAPATPSHSADQSKTSDHCQPGCGFRHRRGICVDLECQELGELRGPKIVVGYDNQAARTVAERWPKGNTFKIIQWQVQRTEIKDQCLADRRVYCTGKAGNASHVGRPSQVYVVELNRIAGSGNACGKGSFECKVVRARNILQFHQTAGGELAGRRGGDNGIGQIDIFSAGQTRSRIEHKDAVSSAVCGSRSRAILLQRILSGGHDAPAAVDGQAFERQIVADAGEASSAGLLVVCRNREVADKASILVRFADKSIDTQTDIAFRGINDLASRSQTDRFRINRQRCIWAAIGLQKRCHAGEGDAAEGSWGQAKLQTVKSRCIHLTAIIADGDEAISCCIIIDARKPANSGADSCGASWHDLLTNIGK